MKKTVGIVVLALAALVAVKVAKERAHPAVMQGLWFEREPSSATDEMRFYYFGKEGIGLYRYGQGGYNQTNSFDWRVRGDELELRFRKSGEQAATRFRLGEENGRRTLTLLADPRGPGEVRYRYTPSRLDVSGPLDLHADASRPASEAVAGRMWIDLRRYATGGMGFSMYQFSEHASAPGWRRGWHHVGDFDDWTTEQLDYHVDGGALSLRYMRGGDGTTQFVIGRDRDQRTLSLTRDPRNFLHRSRFVDAGPSF